MNKGLVTLLFGFVILAVVHAINLASNMPFTHCYGENISCWLNAGICNQDPPEQFMKPEQALREDTLGMLISKQKLWRIPGLDHIAHGFDVTTGIKASQPIFLFCYELNSTKARRLQDTYRNNVYMIPDEVYATAYPQCAFSTTSRQYSSSQDLAWNFLISSGLQLQAGGSFLYWGIKFSAEASFSLDATVSYAKNIQTKKTGGISVGEASCATSSITLDDDEFTSFHPQFVYDLYNTVDSEEMIAVVNKYGTHYYKTAIMGGKLSQVSSTDYNYMSKKTELEVSTKVEVGLKGSATGYGAASVGGSASMNLQTDYRKDEQEEFETNTVRSSIISYGGAPGSFGPDLESSSFGDWGSWAKTVDLLPVPIKYTLKEISAIIPDNWLDRNNNSIRTKWTNSAITFLNSQRGSMSRSQFSDRGNYVAFIAIEHYDFSGSTNGYGPFGLKFFDGSVRPFSAAAFTSVYPDINNVTYFSTVIEQLESRGKVRSFTTFQSTTSYLVTFQQTEVTNFSGIVGLCNEQGSMGMDISDQDLTDLRPRFMWLLDKYYGRVYYYPLKGLQSNAPCNIYTPSLPPNQLLISYYTTNTGIRRDLTSSNSLVQITVVGTSGNFRFYSSLIDFLLPEPTLNYSPIRMTMEQKVPSNLGDIKRLDMELLLEEGENAITDKFNGYILGTGLIIINSYEMYVSMYETISPKGQYLNKDSSVSFGVEKM